MLVHTVAVRADARRNRSRILDAARALVAQVGVQVTMDDIARGAGVAVGTLYRHFPAKDDLVAAVVDDGTAQVAAMAESALDAVERGAPPGPELTALFRAVAERHASDRAFKAATGMLDYDLEAELARAAPDSSAGRAVRAITALLDRARADGAVRADLTLGDLVVLLGSVPGLEVGAQQRERYLDIVLAGLRG
jgi:AcrR family transcriptional regulator